MFSFSYKHFKASRFWDHHKDTALCCWKPHSELIIFEYRSLDGVIMYRKLCPYLYRLSISKIIHLQFTFVNLECNLMAGGQRESHILHSSNMYNILLPWFS